MTLYMLFAGLGILIYAGSALAEAASAAVSDARVAFGFQLAYFRHTVDFLRGSHPLLHESPHAGALVHRLSAPSAWRGRVVVAALVFFTGGVAVFIAATREPGVAPTCAGPCGAGGGCIRRRSEPHLDERISNRVVACESLEHCLPERRCFRSAGVSVVISPDATGAGPTLHGLFGSPVQYPGSGTGIVDESYLREAILNPSATVAVGFSPLMPTFAGQLTEEELQALIVYVKSLSVPVRVDRR